MASDLCTRSTLLMSPPSVYFDSGRDIDAFFSSRSHPPSSNSLSSSSLHQSNSMDQDLNSESSTYSCRLSKFGSPIASTTPIRAGTSNRQKSPSAHRNKDFCPTPEVDEPETGSNAACDLSFSTSPTSRRTRTTTTTTTTCKTERRSYRFSIPNFDEHFDNDLRSYPPRSPPLSPQTPLATRATRHNRTGSPASARATAKPGGASPFPRMRSSSLSSPARRSGSSIRSSSRQFHGATMSHPRSSR